MTTLLICLPLILIVAGLLVRRWIAASRQDMRSIESHRSNLDRLEHLAPDHSASLGGAEPGSAHVRVVGSSSVAVASAVRPMTWGRVDGRAPAARPSWHQPREDPVATRFERARLKARQADTGDTPRIVITDPSVVGRPAVDDAPPEPTRRGYLHRPSPHPVPDGPSVSPPLPIDDLDEEVARDETAVAAVAPTVSDRTRGPSRHRVRAVAAAAAGLAVVGGGAAVAVTELHPFAHPASHRDSSAAVSKPTTGTAAPTPVRTAVAPTTVPAPPPALTATSSTATDGTYTVTGGQLQLSLTASGPCWVELRNGSPTGPVVFEGIIAAGSSQSFSAGGAAWLRLGDPGGVQLRINGSSVRLPTAANPYNVTVTAA